VAEEIGVATHAGDGALPAVRKPVAAASVGSPEPAIAAPPVSPVLVEVMDRIAGLDPERMTPIEALVAVAELKRLAER
jgi:DNA mismatch repair protein MutS